MFAVATLLTPFAAGAPIKQLASAYSFCVAVALAAVVGERGLIGDALGAATSLLASLLLVYAAFESL